MMELGSSEDTFKYIPLRCYLLHKDNCLVQRLVKPLTEQGHRKTLGSALQELFPDDHQSSKLYYLALYHFMSSLRFVLYLINF